MKQLSLLPPRWVCDYCGLTEADCTAAKNGLSITLIDANNPEEKDDEE